MNRDPQAPVARASDRTTRRASAVSVGVMAFALLLGACGNDGSAQAPDGAPPAEAPQTPQTATLPATTAAPTMPTTTSLSATNPATTTDQADPDDVTPTTDSVDPSVAAEVELPRCRLTGAGVEQIVVFGNSTDYTFGPDDAIEAVAWPERLISEDSAGLLTGITVRNEAQRGQTMGDWDAWGPDPLLRLRGFALTVIESIEPERRSATLALVAPSFIDLQESDADIERGIADLSVVVDSLESAGLTTLVLPMNYVSTSLNDRLPDLNPAVEAFNQQLLTRRIVASPFVDSPLRTASTPLGGDDRLFDDFPGWRNGRFTGADGFHPDADGQTLKADAVNQALRTFVTERVDCR